MDIFEAEMARRFVVAIEKIANALDRKTEATISKMEQVEDEPQTCEECDQVGRCERGRAVDCPLTERNE